MDEKEQRILQQLSTGKTREELAAEEGNTHWKSIDMYMRRRDYVWCSERHNYIKTDEQSIPEVIAKASDDGLLRTHTKADRIVQALAREGADVRQVAKQYEFSDYEELAVYMAGKGYQWDVKQHNYRLVERPPREKAESPEAQSSLTTESHDKAEEGYSAAISIKNSEYSDELWSFLHELYDQREVLQKLFKETDQQLPNYLVKGTRKGKTFQMSILLANLAEDYARDYSLTQREVIEIALVEFFQRYGYDKEVATLLN